MWVPYELKMRCSGLQYVYNQPWWPSPCLHVWILRDLHGLQVGPGWFIYISPTPVLEGRCPAHLRPLPASAHLIPMNGSFNRPVQSWMTNWRWSIHSQSSRTGVWHLWFKQTPGLWLNLHEARFLTLLVHLYLADMGLLFAFTWYWNRVGPRPFTHLKPKSTIRNPVLTQMAPTWTYWLGGKGNCL